MYIKHRLWVAGSDGSIIFDNGAVKDIYKHTRGSPRVINALCDNALLAGYVAKTKRIDTRCVRAAIQQLEGPK